MIKRKKQGFKRITQKTTYWATRTPQNPGDKPVYSGRTE